MQYRWIVGIMLSLLPLISCNAATLEEVSVKFQKEKQAFESKDKELTTAKNQLSQAEQAVRDAQAHLDTKTAELQKEDETYEIAQKYARRKGISVDAKAEADFKAAKSAENAAQTNLQAKQQLESAAITRVQQLQSEREGLAGSVNRLAQAVSEARFEALRAQFGKRTDVQVKMEFACGEEMNTKQCREAGYKAVVEEAQRRGAISLIKSVTVADLNRLQVTEDKVKEELTALAVSQKPLSKENVLNGVYYGEWLVQVEGQVPDSLRETVTVAGVSPITPTQPIRTSTSPTKGGFRSKLKNGQPCSFCPEMVTIPAGKSMKSFAAGKYEVTFEEYDYFAQQTSREKPNDSGWGRGKRPVMNVTWHDAVAYAEWLSQETGKQYRLPTEAEWEYAARGGTTTDYWWGNDVGKNNANCDGCGSQWDNKQTAPVGSFKPNPFGLYDTAGNVWEWTCSDYGTGTENECSENTNKNKSLRGGSWFDFANYCHAALRYNYTPSNRFYIIGFRLMLFSR